MDNFIKDIKNFTDVAGKTVSTLQKTVNEVREKLSPEDRMEFDKKLASTDWGTINTELEKANSLLSKLTY